MKKLLAVVFIGVFAVSFAIGIMATTAEAFNPTLCKFECIDGDTYLCCWVHKYWTCGFYEEGCGPPP